MNDFLSKFRIPTLLGLGIIISAITAGVFLVLKEQTITSQASPNLTVQNITLTNLSDDSATIFWQTSAALPSFITLGSQNPSETTILDDRDTIPASDNAGPKARLLHYATIKNLLPKTTYRYKITSGNSSSDTFEFTTAAPLNFQTGQRPVIGSVLDGDKPLAEAVAILSITNAATQSALIKEDGNFLIPISQVRKADLSEGISLTENTTAKLTILSTKGQAAAIFRLADFENGLPPIVLGENLDLTSLKENLTKYDLNADGGINSTDYSIVFQNLGPLREAFPQRKQVGKNPKADLNSDGVVDQKDLDLISKQINK